MKLVVLGSNGYRANDLGHTACYAIPELGIVLDAGTGMYRLVDYLQTEEFDVYLSHSHPDHVTGLTNLEFIFWRKMKREALARGSNERILMARFDTPGEVSAQSSCPSCSRTHAGCAVSAPEIRRQQHDRICAPGGYCGDCARHNDSLPFRWNTGRMSCVLAFGLITLKDH